MVIPQAWNGLLSTAIFLTLSCTLFLLKTHGAFEPPPRREVGASVLPNRCLLRDAGLGVKLDDVRALPLVHAERVPHDELDSEMIRLGNRSSKPLAADVVDNAIVDDLARGETPHNMLMGVALRNSCVGCHGQLRDVLESLGEYP